MFLVTDIEKLKNYGFKEYKNGLSKKINGSYDFLDVDYKDFVVKKVKLKDGEFIYENATSSDLKELIENEVVVEKLEVEE